MWREPLRLARLGHPKRGPERAVEIARRADRVAVHHGIAHPGRISRCGDQGLADLLADEAHAAEQLDPGREPHRATHPRRRDRLDGASLKRDDRPHESRPPIREAIGDRCARAMRHDHRARHTEVIERRRDPVGLGGERVVRALRPARAADAERLDNDGAIRHLREARDHLAVGERRSEQSRDEHDGSVRLGSRDRDLQRLSPGKHQRKRPRTVGKHQHGE
jgi:hypothetical protein